MNKLPEILQWPTGKLDFSAGSLVMGILNITPDSFSDGGDYLEPSAAVTHGVQMAQQGAAILDVGAESTRPGSKPVSAADQIQRIVPVIKQLVEQVDIPISIDTYDPQVAQAALQAGASMINDITAFADEKMVAIAVEHRVPVILMHMQGTPQTMQQNPVYEDVVTEVLEYLMERAKYAESFGISSDRIFLDPGIGFGKTTEHNLQLLNRLDLFTELGYRVLIGTSRKRFIGPITGKTEPKERIFGTAATVALAIEKGASIVRVHDVPEMVEVVTIADAIQKRGIRK